MENINNMGSGFKINNIILIESNFSRINNVIFKDAKNDISINVGVSVNGKNVSVEESLFFVLKFNDVKQVNINVKMIGLFELIGESPITDLEKFGRINGASIIFPFIREHVANLSLKAGLGNIILPPVNFTMLAEKK